MSGPFDPKEFEGKVQSVYHAFHLCMDGYIGDDPPDYLLVEGIIDLEAMVSILITAGVIPCRKVDLEDICDVLESTAPSGGR